LLKLSLENELGQDRWKRLSQFSHSLKHLTDMVAIINEGPWNWVVVSGSRSKLKKENERAQVS